MRKSYVALALLVGAAAALASTAFARTDEFGADNTPAKLINAQLNSEMRSAVARPGVAGGNDTVYIGFRPGKVSATNYWGIGKGNFRVWSPNPADYGYWGWDNDGNTVPVGNDVTGVDNITEVHGDSLFGWWPWRNIMNGAGGQTRTDDNRPWWALDIGNNVNYTINQGAAHKRTFGVVGVWHVDVGNTGAGAGKGVGWTPLNGSTSSLWCGLRRHGDVTVSDPITGNAFNAALLMHSGVNGGSATGGTGTQQKFPGYGSQWDQMAYRDIDITGASTMQVKFRFRTNMSTGRGTAANTRTGWFDKDPLQVTTGGAAVGNFISSSAAGDANCPIDSFMVYVGVPINDAAGWLGSDGAVHNVYDPARRYFSEVLKVYPIAGNTYKEIFTTYGDNAEQVANPAALDLTSLAWGNKARLVFRNKTNRGFDDEGGSALNSYSSLGQGAVIIDDVQVSIDGGTYNTIGDFEAASAVDNDLSVNPLDAWKTTGKPPAVYDHVHSTDLLIYQDICGPIGFVKRVCNLNGNVVSGGDHDHAEANSGLVPGTAEREAWHGILSPTVNLRNGGPPYVFPNAPGPANAMDIDNDTAATTEDYYCVYDIYTGVMDPFTKGVLWRFGFTHYPCRQSDNIPVWGDMRYPGFIIFNPDKQCFIDFEGDKQNGLGVWRAALAEGGAAYPDSIKMFLGTRQECYRFGVVAGCSSTDGTYWDNVTMAFIDGEVPPVTVDIWQFINDTFTVNGLNRNVSAVNTAAFDTTAALVKTGLNIAQSPGTLLRYDVPGDTTALNSAGGNLRVDMIFRINPGPGNYHTLGVPASGLRPVPTDETNIATSGYTGPNPPSLGNFWGAYLADNGGRGTGGSQLAAPSVTTEGSGPGHPGGNWSKYVWNSARCDTAEINFWEIQGRPLGGVSLDVFATMYDEHDPKYTKLGIIKNRCFLTSPTATNNQLNTTCSGAPTWALASNGGGLPEPEIAGQANGKTYEFTKIMPDGQFTPGTHVEYFFRREDGPIAGGPYLAPDTMVVFPQASEGSTDAHRWQEFSVLPDNWKKGGYGGLGPACMLYVDYNDRRGNERVWVSIADSIGATRSTKYGVHNGWHQVGKEDVNDVSGWVYDNQQPGTTWDMFGVKASESLNTKAGTIGSDNSYKAGGTAVTNKWSFQGPSLNMLKTYYHVLLLLTGDLNSGILGPFSNLSNDDTKMLQDFLLEGLSGDHRGFWAQGDGFVESEDGSDLLVNYLQVFLRDKSYSILTGNTDDCADLVTQTPITTNGDVYGVSNSCTFTNDVMDVGPGSQPAVLYEPVVIPALAPIIASVFKDVDNVNGEYWQALVDGWDVEHLRSRHCDKSIGRLAYYYNVLTNIFAKICPIAGAPAITTDVPQNESGQQFVDFMNLKNNPLMTGRATVDFGLSRADRVEVRVFDVSGRLVRTLADRQFAPGKYSLTWDGVDNDGRQVARGVYFTQVRYVGRGFADARKLTVLK